MEMLFKQIEEKRRRLDKLTSIERIHLLLIGRQIDRVPLFPFGLSCGTGWFCAKNMGFPIQSACEDPEKSFFSQQETQKQFGYDSSPILSYASHGAWEFGGDIKFPATELDQAPQVIRHPCKTVEDVKKLKLPDVKTAGILPLVMKFSRLQEERSLLPITFPCGSPFSYAGNIVGIDQLCRWVIKEPDCVHMLLRLCTDHILQVAEYWIETFGPERMVAHEILPFESNMVISKKHFVKFALPYLMELHNSILDMKIKRFFSHICGEQKFNLAQLEQIPMGERSIVSFGPEVSLTTAIEHFGDRCIIAGNIDPTALQNGTFREVYDLSRKCIEEAKFSPCGFILAPGCDLSPITPQENIYAMMEAVLDFGYYDA